MDAAPPIPEGQIIPKSFQQPLQKYDVGSKSPNKAPGKLMTISSKQPELKQEKLQGTEKTQTCDSISGDKIK